MSFSCCADDKGKKQAEGGIGKRVGEEGSDGKDSKECADEIATTSPRSSPSRFKLSFLPLGSVLLSSIDELGRA